MADFAIRLLDPSSVAEPDWTFFWMGFESLKKFRPSWHGWLCPSTLILWQPSISKLRCLLNEAWLMIKHIQYTIITQLLFHIIVGCMRHHLLLWSAGIILFCVQGPPSVHLGSFLSPIVLCWDSQLRWSGRRGHSEQSREGCPQEPIRDTGYWLAET